MKIVVSGNLMRFTDYQKELDVDAPTVRGALDALIGRYPGLKPVLLDGNGSLRSVHRMHLNGEVLLGSELGRAVETHDELGVLTALAGG